MSDGTGTQLGEPLCPASNCECAAELFMLFELRRCYTWCQACTSMIQAAAVVEQGAHAGGAVGVQRT